MTDNTQVGNAKGVATMAIVLAAIILLFIVGGKIFGMFDGLFTGLGLKDSKEGKENKEYIDKTVNKENSKGTSSPWSINFWRNYSKSYANRMITGAQAEVIAKDLWDSVGYVYDSPGKGLAAIKKINSQINLSWVSYMFNQKYKLDLLTWLNDKYDVNGQREYLREIFEYTNNLQLA